MPIDTLLAGDAQGVYEYVSSVLKDSPRVCHQKNCRSDGLSDKTVHHYATDFCGLVAYLDKNATAFPMAETDIPLWEKAIDAHIYGMIENDINAKIDASLACTVRYSTQMRRRMSVRRILALVGEREHIFANPLLDKIKKMPQKKSAKDAGVTSRMRYFSPEIIEQVMNAYASQTTLKYVRTLLVAHFAYYELMPQRLMRSLTWDMLDGNVGFHVQEPYEQPDAVEGVYNFHSCTARALCSFRTHAFEKGIFLASGSILRQKNGNSICDRVLRKNLDELAKTNIDQVTLKGIGCVNFHSLRLSGLVRLRMDGSSRDSSERNELYYAKRSWNISRESSITRRSALIVRRFASVGAGS